MSDAMRGDARDSIRRAMKARRAAVSPEDRAARSHTLCLKLQQVLGDAKLVCCYEALKTELDLTEFIAFCRAKGVTVVFPEERRLPNGDRAFTVPRADEVDLWICPGLAFTLRGERLGFGGGWYDRFLAAARSGARAYGVAYPFQLVDDLPQGPWDRRLDGVITAGENPYVIWDWNGTLLDDTQAALSTLNKMLAARGAPPVEMAYYRDHFSFPVRPFYERIGMQLEREDWDALAREYHEIYSREPKNLNGEALAALRAVACAGARQAVLSALRQDLLEADLRRYGIREFFDCVYGVDNLDGASKLARGKELVAALTARGVTKIMMIGDALHDWEVATAIGARCVLCGQGSHSPARLRAVAPTGETLLQSVRMVLNDQAG